MQSIILCDIPDAQSSIDEERLNWAYSVLAALNIPEEVLSVRNIDEYREKMEEFGIEVELTTAGDVNIYKKTWHNGGSPERSGWLPAGKSNLVAQWKEPTYIKKIEGNTLYYEIHLNEWSSVRKING